MTVSRRVKSVQLRVMGPMSEDEDACSGSSFATLDTIHGGVVTLMMNILSTLSAPTLSLLILGLNSSPQYGPHIPLNVPLYDNLPHNSW